MNYENTIEFDLKPTTETPRFQSRNTELNATLLLPGKEVFNKFVLLSDPPTTKIEYQTRIFY